MIGFYALDLNSIFEDDDVTESFLLSFPISSFYLPFAIRVSFKGENLIIKVSTMKIKEKRVERRRTTLGKMRNKKRNHIWLGMADWLANWRAG